MTNHGDVNNVPRMPYLREKLSTTEKLIRHAAAKVLKEKMEEKRAKNTGKPLSGAKWCPIKQKIQVERRWHA